MKAACLRVAAAATAVVTSLTSCGSSEPTSADGTVTLKLLIDNAEATVAAAESVVRAFEAAEPTVEIDTETRPGGAEGDNIVKTRLSTGEMADVFWYNSGSLIQALNPSQTLVDLTGDPVLANVQESYLPVVSHQDKVYGVPAGTAAGGGILYNRKVYADLGLETPRSWAEFMANNDKVKAAGLAPVISTFKETWTSQLFVLGDFYNVQAAVPAFAAGYTANKAKYATTPAALSGFRKLAEVHAAGLLNDGFGSATLDNGLKLLAEGKGAHYPMLTGVMPALIEQYPSVKTDIGFFGIPGDDPGTHGATVWEPAGAYIPASSEHVDAAKKFLAFIASPAGAQAFSEGVAPTGPYRIKGAELPEDVIQVAKDLSAYIESGASAPALEFVSPVKGPSLEQITVAVGSGLTTPAEGAAQYDKDVEKQARQLGLAGW
ncbi:MULTISPECIES: ABC transporter substrate-binding protein [Nonomuraea]|uniref:Extracellular solute-binding protein n=1 Tax=Nonomuraea ferruginea TaxID=46174 RepID=A0ABT4T9F9_9ACTN|nr:extracellular solute-binding protein [Nonomuraea ferruginea]MDA0646147.1 extracellular solute-binding protein [Nonomuraea ferruginea]